MSEEYGIARCSSVYAPGREAAVAVANRFGGAATGPVSGLPDHTRVGAFDRQAAPPDLKRIFSMVRRFSPPLLNVGVSVSDEIETLNRQVAALAASGAKARAAGNETEAEKYFRRGFALAADAVKRTPMKSQVPGRLEVLRVAARLALDCGEVAEARRLMEEAFTIDASSRFSDEWAQIRDIQAWPDPWLVAAVRRDPPDGAALDALANRYWKALFGRCQLLTVNHDKANDLAQQAWCRILRARHGLKPGGNFAAYLATIATNLWRDAHRGARRAGPMAEDRMSSLDETFSTNEGESIALGDVLPDLKSLGAEDQTLLAMDIDNALGNLTPQLREVLVARFITGESCAEIALRHGRTEQSISGWVRQALREMKLHLEAASGRVAVKA